MSKKNSLHNPIFSLTNQASPQDDFTIKQKRCLTSMKSLANLHDAKSSPGSNREYAESIGLVNGPSSVHV